MISDVKRNIYQTRMLTSGEESKSSLMIIPLPWRIASSGLRGDVVGAMRYQQKVLLIYIYIHVIIPTFIKTVLI